MKRVLFIIAILSSFLQFAGAQPTVHGTIKMDGPVTVGVYLKPLGGNITGALANFNLTVSIDAQGETDPGLAPVPASVTSLTGVAINALAVEIINGRFVYAYVVTGNVTGGINWVNGNEYLVLTVQFPNDPIIDGQIVQLNDFGESFGGNSGQALFDIGVNGNFYVDYADMFYGTNATNIEFGDSFVEIATPLPVTLVSFNAQKFQEKSSWLSWSTSSEFNSSYFLIQRSSDKVHWTTFGKIAAAGYSQVIQNYAFLDENIYNGLDSKLSVYYRLQMVDLDGQTKTSPIVNIVFGNNDSPTGREFIVYPSPATDGIHVEWDANQVSQPTTIEFYDVSGKLIHSEKVPNQTNQKYVDFGPTNIQTGLYLVRMLSGTEAIEHKQIVVNRN